MIAACQEKLQLSQKPPLEKITTDLMSVIQQIEERPDISNWTIRMTLKAIRDKAQTAAQNSIEPEKLAS